MCLCVLAIASASVAGPLAVMAPDVLRLSPERRDAVVSVVAAPVVVVVAAIVAASSLALSAVVALIGVVALLGSGCAPTDPGYLDRAPDAKPVAVVVETPAVVRTAVLNGYVVVDADREIRRLQDCETRALNSRHIARAASYRARWLDLVRQDYV